MGNLMGTMHSSKPVLRADKKMSDEHKARRATIDDKPHTPDNLRKSISYNRLHAAEHEAAAKANEKELKKSAKAAEYVAGQSYKGLPVRSSKKK